MLVYGQNGLIFPDFPRVAEVVHARALVACLSSGSDNVCRQYHLRPQPAQSSCLTRDNVALGSVVLLGFLNLDINTAAMNTLVDNS